MFEHWAPTITRVVQSTKADIKGPDAGILSVCPLMIRFASSGRRW